MSGGFRILPPSPPRFAEWRELYRAYAEFYRAPPPDFDIVWRWLTGGVLHGIAAADESDALRGIAHWAKIPRPLQAKPLAYMHDLFVSPQVRGRGVGELLIAEVSRAAKREGCAAVRWATAADNRAAMRLYDRVAARTSWVIYEKPSG